MREFWAFVSICAAVIAAFATAMLVVIVQTGHNRDMAGYASLVAVGGWVLAYLAFKYLRAIPRKNTDIW
jgi:hypothetical protein